MIDKTRLSNEIEIAADRWLRDISSFKSEELKSHITYFAENCRDGAEGILEDYMREVYYQYTKGKHSIKNEEIRSLFNNLDNGYQQQMIKWINNNHPELKDESIDIPKEPEFYIDSVRTTNVKIALTLGSGLIVSVGLFLFTNIWIAIAAEILSMAIAGGVYVKANSDRRKYQADLNFYKMSVENMKSELIHFMASELDKWLDAGVQESDRILKSFGI